MQNICRFFEDEEILKRRHILIENYKAVLYPNPQDISLKMTSAEQAGQTKAPFLRKLKKKM